MQKHTLLNLVLLGVAALATSPASGQTPIADPIPEPIEFGALTMELEDWITIESSGGGGGKARLSVMRSLPDGRLFVNDLRGLIHRIDTGTPQLYLNFRQITGLSTSFIDTPGLGTGFQSFAFHPDFATNGKFYTVHSERWNAVSTVDFKGPVVSLSSGGMQSVLSEWTASNPAANTFSGTRREILRAYFPGTYHNMQEVAFNPNAQPGHPDYGMLFLSIGEGGSYLTGNWQNQQRLDSPMGTVFRIDPLGNDSANGQYGIPHDNPWYDSSIQGVIREIYAYGFRNPHRFNWDTGGSHRLYLGDIGELNIEELNLLLPGHDYGFPQREGTFVLDPTNRPWMSGNNALIYPLPANDEQFGYTYPVAQYDHDEGLAITLGPVYRGASIPPLYGKLFFGDIVEGRIFVVDELSLEPGQQARIEEVRLTLGDVEGTLRSFVGSSRADLRFGTDLHGEMYIMTKTDGKIRRVVNAVNTTGAGFDNDPQRWQTAHNFSSETPQIQLLAEVSATSVTREGNPFGDTGDTVLSLGGTGTIVGGDIPPTANATSGSAYFRFAMSDESSTASFALADTANFSLANVLGTVNAANGQLRVLDGSNLITLTENLRPAVWYEIWLVFPTDERRYNLYIRGDRWTIPTLLRSGILPARSFDASLTKWMWRIGEGSAAGSRIHVDDIHVDTDGANISLPRDQSWALLANFETERSLNDWSFMDDTNGTLTGPALSSAQLYEEWSGNRYLQMAASAQDTTVTHAWAPLPRRVELSETVTLYGRMRVEDFSTNQVWGLANVPESQIVPLRLDAIDASAGYTNQHGSNQLLVRDGETDEEALAPAGGYTTGQWYEYWMVVRNFGHASGGQTFDLYLRTNNSNELPQKVYTDAGFRTARETPLSFFSIIASNGFAGYTGAIGYDDIFIIEGTVLETPQGTGWGLFPGARGIKNLPWLGWISDTFFPWVYNPGHGWLFAAGNDPGLSWFHDPQLGWIWLKPELYPYGYAIENQHWYYFDFKNPGDRWFYDFETQQWVNAG